MSRTYRDMYRHAEVARRMQTRRRSKLYAALLRLLQVGGFGRFGW